MEKDKGKRGQRSMDTKKIVRVNNNVIDFHADAKAALKQSSEKRSRSVNTEIVKGLGQPNRKIDFLNDQLGNTKNELAIFRNNHKTLVEQMMFVQKDFKRRLRLASEEKRLSEEKLKKVVKAYKTKEKELDVSAKRLEEVKIKFNQLHATYADKVEKFKFQHKARIGEKEEAFGRKSNLLIHEKDKLQQSLDRMMDTVRQKNEKVSVLEGDLKRIRTEMIDLEKLNRSLSAFKEDNQEAVANLKRKLVNVRIELSDSLKEQKEKEKALELLTYKHEATTEDAETHRKRAEDLEQRVFSLKNYIEGKKAKIESYEQTIADLRAGSLEANKLADELRDFQISESSLRTEILDLKETKARYERKINEQGAELLTYKDSFAKLKTASEKESKLREAAEEKIQDLEALEQSNGAEIINLKGVVADLKRNIDLGATKIEELNSELDTFEGQNDKLNSECAALEDHIAAITSELKVATEQNHASLDNMNSFNEKIAELSSEVMDLKDEKEALKGQIQDLNADIDGEKQKYQSLEKELAEKLNDLEVANNREADFIEARQEWADSKEALELRISDFTAQIDEKDRDILGKQDAIEGYIKEIKDLNIDLDAIRKQILALEEEKGSILKSQDILIGKTEILTDSKSQFETDARDKAEKLRRAEKQIETLERDYRSSRQRVEALEKKLFKSEESYSLKAGDYEEEIEQVKKQKHELEMEIQARDEKISGLEESLNAANINIDRVQKEAHAHQVKISNMSDQIGMFDGGKADLVKTIDDKKNEVDELMRRIATETEKTKLLEEQLVEKTQIIETMELDFVEREDASPSDAGVQKRLGALKAKEESFTEEIEKRREELGLYSRWVDSQKESLKKHMVRFSQELKLSLTINPLHSYLTMTEKELAKVEILLAKPGVVGAQRTHLEEHHQVLSDQQKYIAELVEKTTKDVEKRVGEVMGLLKQGEFVPVPPLPPKK